MERLCCIDPLGATATITMAARHHRSFISARSDNQHSETAFVEYLRGAEVQTRQRMAELAHTNRCATAGELSASIAHELKQPLTAIHSNAEAAKLILHSTSPDLHEIEDIVTDIRKDDERASEVLRRLGGLLKKNVLEPQDIDLNETVIEVFTFISVLANARGIMLPLRAGYPAAAHSRRPGSATAGRSQPDHERD